ncbi:MAG: DUF2807 domain-containing protein [Gemmatimonadaceae bacterium]|nr:DUF2807 domain-containing protein [Chitinophagaceae bacterium]
MKKAFNMLLITLLIAGTSAKSQTGEPNYGVKETLVQNFSRIRINADINVVLVQNDKLSRVYTEGDESLLGEIIVRVKGNELFISSTRPISYKGKLQVTIPVSNIEKIEVNSAAAIACVNSLKSPFLLVKANNDCDVKIKSRGKVSFETGEGYYIQHMRQTEIRISDAEENTGG